MRYEAVKRKAGRLGKGDKVINGRTVTKEEKNSSQIETNRAVSADIASTARVQSQYGQYIASCERELHRKDLPEERRMELLDRIHDACRASESAGIESREFQQEHILTSSEG